MGDTCSACKAHGQQAEIRNINLQPENEKKEDQSESHMENVNGLTSSLKEKTKSDQKSNLTQSSKNMKMNKTTFKKYQADVSAEDDKENMAEETAGFELSQRKEAKNPELNSLVSQPINPVSSAADGNVLDKMPDFLNDITRQKLEKLPPFNYNHPQFEVKGAEKRGPIEFEGKYVYEGQWKDGKRAGKGKQVWKDGAFYEGYWLNNMANGYGRLIHTDGDTYEGDWLSDRAEGYGVYSHICGAVFKGNWKDDKQEGYGQEIWPDGAVYNGHYVRGKKQGKGKFEWSDNSCYEGDFLDNNISGYGRYRWKDGRIFQGTWVMNKMEGKGVFTWPDGRKYEGQYKNDKKHGFGIFYWPDGRVYKGQWFDGKQHGRGQYKSRKGHNRQGIWQAGVRTKWLNGDPNKGTTSYSSDM